MNLIDASEPRCKYNFLTNVNNLSAVQTDARKVAIKEEDVVVFVEVY